jgi:two-component system response regulator PilR (NtrC family)
LNYRILVVDDEINMLNLLKKILSKEGYEVTTCPTAEEALEQLGRKVYDLIVADLVLPGMNGIELLKAVKKDMPNMPFILITAFASIESAVEAMKMGAFDYLAKPFQTEEIKITIRKAIEQQELSSELQRLRTEVRGQYRFQNIIGRSKKMLSLYNLITKVADSMSTILLQGESGTGKELFAKAIHYNSSRVDKPFVAVECSVLPETLLESELFGHTKGAFTGAIRAKKGLFEQAHGGTIFLDEIGEISLAMQSKLLRVLQEREIRPVGSNEVIKVDVRVIAATNTELKEAVKAKTFREDLFYRIAVIPISIPPLRERKEDIPLLVEHFISKYCRINNKNIKSISLKALSLLTDYNWPGNVRELENVIERAILISERDEIGIDCLPSEIQMPKTALINSQSGGSFEEKLTKAKEEIELQFIKLALKKHNGNKSLAAKELGMSRGSLYNKIKHHNL